VLSFNKNICSIGILSNTSTDDAGPIPMEVDAKKQLQDDFQNYGLTHDQWQIIITDANLKWQQIALPIKDMMLGEFFSNDEIQIANAYMFPIPLMNNFKSAAGQANMAQFNKQLYTDKIIPDWEMFQNALNNYFIEKSKNKKDLILK